MPLRAVASFVAYQEFGLDVQPTDVFWNAADPGWAYGLYYAIVGPLASGIRSILVHAGFSPELTWQVFEQFGVTNFAAAPTVYRGLRAAGQPAAGHTLRRASSAGEPLTPDVVSWSEETLGVRVHDHYGQTELGMVICDAWHDEIAGEVPVGLDGPGSAGLVVRGPGE